MIIKLINFDYLALLLLIDSEKLCLDDDDGKADVEVALGLLCFEILSPLLLFNEGTEPNTRFSLFIIVLV